MALKMPKLFGAKAKLAGDGDLDMPTTQVKMNQNTPAGYDPLASVSIMEQLRTATATMKQPSRLPLIGHLPVTKQFQVLGVLMVTFRVLAALMVYFQGRIATQASVSAAAATEMQMLSQRLARGSALAAQGQPTAFAAVKDSREKFSASVRPFVISSRARRSDE